MPQFSTLKQCCHKRRNHNISITHLLVTESQSWGMERTSEMGPFIAQMGKLKPKEGKRGVRAHGAVNGQAGTGIQTLPRGAKGSKRVGWGLNPEAGSKGQEGSSVQPQQAGDVDGAGPRHQQHEADLQRPAPGPLQPARPGSLSRDTGRPHPSAAPLCRHFLWVCGQREKMAALGEPVRLERGECGRGPGRGGRRGGGGPRRRGNRGGPGSESRASLPFGLAPGAADVAAPGPRGASAASWWMPGSRGPPRAQLRSPPVSVRTRRRRALGLGAVSPRSPAGLHARRPRLGARPGHAAASTLPCARGWVPLPSPHLPSVCVGLFPGLGAPPRYAEGAVKQPCWFGLGRKVT